MGLIILHGRKKKGGKPMELEEAPQRPPHFMSLGILGVKVIPKVPTSLTLGTNNCQD